MAFNWNWKTREPMVYNMSDPMFAQHANGRAVNPYGPLFDPASASPEYIRDMQQELGVKADGIWGKQSQKAYNMAMQKELGVPADGVWGPKSQAAYDAATYNPAYEASLRAYADAKIANEQQMYRQKIDQRNASIQQIDQQIAANNAQIAQLKQELSQLTMTADDFDRRLAQNRAGIGDMGNAQIHLGRIETRKQAEANRKNAERLRMMDKLGKNGEEFDSLMNLAKMRTNLEAVAKDPGLRSGMEREYNIAVQQYKNKYGHEPDFSNFENSVDLFYDRSSYKVATDEDLAKDSATLTNFITNNVDTSGRWTAGDAELKRAIVAAEKQGNAKLAKQLRNTWTPEQYRKYTDDMNSAGEAAREGLNEFQYENALDLGKFTDSQKRNWVMKNGKWTSADYKWNGKRNGV